MRRILSWETITALACGPLCLVPVLRWPAGLALLAFLPGIAIARHVLGERDPVRLFILGGALSLATVPAIAIPLALAAGKPTLLIGAVTAVIITAAASLATPLAAGHPPAAGSWRAFAIVAALCLVLQAAITIAKFPSPDEIRWRGLPDLVFFKGIYSQLQQATPPFDPENGRELLVHNWIYHFHFVLLGEAMGLGPLASQRVASAWLALVLLGLAHLLGTEILGSRTGASIAGLFLMSGGEIYWVVRAVVRREIELIPMGWVHSPMGVTMLIGWYNLAPFVAGLAAWYAFERGRSSGERRWTWASVGLCTMMAFFHPVFYAVFMTAFCLWLGRLWLDRQGSPAWMAYLLTPLPFFLLYKLPYYGWSMPPKVVHLDLALAQVLDRGQNLALRCGILIPPALLGLWAAPHGFLVTLATISIALELALETPNPHWFGDLFYIGLALAAGAGLARLIERRPAGGRIAAAAALILAATSLALGIGTALGTRHVYGPDEKSAAAWLRESTGPGQLVAIHPNSRSSYAVIGLADRRLVHGWTLHIHDFKPDAREQEAATASIFRSENPEEAAATARRLGADVVWVGPDERLVTPEGRLPDRCFRLLHSSGEISILEPVCRDGASPAEDSSAP